MAIINITNNEITGVTASDRRNELVIEGATLKYKNFKGEGSKYNAEGRRNFVLVLTEDVANELYEAGWRVKKNGYDAKLDRRRTGDMHDDLDEAEYRLTVNVNMDSKNPPKAFKKTTKALIPLDEETIGSLDYSDFDDVYLEINGYDGNQTGQLAGYLKTIVATVANDRFNELFGDMPIASN